MLSLPNARSALEDPILVDFPPQRTMPAACIEGPAFLTSHQQGLHLQSQTTQPVTCAGLTKQELEGGNTGAVCPRLRHDEIVALFLEGQESKPGAAGNRIQCHSPIRAV